jgi:hypothetical protein
MTPGVLQAGPGRGRHQQGLQELDPELGLGEAQKHQVRLVRPQAGDGGPGPGRSGVPEHQRRGGVTLVDAHRVVAGKRGRQVARQVRGALDPDHLVLLGEPPAQLGSGLSKPGDDRLGFHDVVATVSSLLVRLQAVNRCVIQPFTHRATRRNRSIVTPYPLEGEAPDEPQRG